ncbi:MAG: hypothetical protein JW727_04435 [Candidatus Aenigmarchaeota archaeon]|nr:hypothetical protein [Candidatus Aenigmarchaeota archaeon]
MQKGYFFSLEALIASLIIISAIAVLSSNHAASPEYEEKIYGGLSNLEKSGKLASMEESEIETRLEETLCFPVSVGKAPPGGQSVKYLLVYGPEKFKTIQIAYQLP